MVHLNKLIGTLFSLSLVVTESRQKNHLVAYLLPSGLVGRAPVQRLEDYVTTHGAVWYPIAHAKTAVEVLQRLEIQIEQAVRARWTDNCIFIPMEKYAAIVWNTAYAKIAHNESVRDMADILAMDDISKLLPTTNEQERCPAL